MLPLAAHGLNTYCQSPSSLNRLVALALKAFSTKPAFRLADFQHLSSPAPGRGSSGVHESGFGRFNPETLSLSNNAIPTLEVVDDTFDKYRDVMAEIIRRAKTRAGIA